MKSGLFHSSRGMVLIFTLITVLLMSLAGASLMKMALFHERISTNHQLDQLTFLAAEAAITSTMTHLERNVSAQEAMLSGTYWHSCLSSAGLDSGECHQAAYSPLASAPNRKLPSLMASARSHHVGQSLVPGFASDQLQYLHFSTEGRGHFDTTSALPFGHLNRQTWRRMTMVKGVFHH